MRKVIYTTLVIFAILSLGCNQDKNDDPETQTSKWDMVINVNLTEPPPPSPFDITGVVDVKIEGKQITFTGDFQVGSLIYEDIVFEGILNGNEVTITTALIEVTFESQGTTYSEAITWVLPPFTVNGNAATANGTIEAVKTPGLLTESGTFTFTVNKQ